MGGRTKRIDEHVGERIRLRRTELGLTQEQLADALDVSYQQIQKYETGANRVSAGRILEIARKLGVDVGYFFEGLSDDDDPARRSSMAAASAPRSSWCASSRQIKDPEVRAAIAGLVKTIVDRAG